jgi:hypothetical protein
MSFPAAPDSGQERAGGLGNGQVLPVPLARRHGGVPGKGGTLRLRSGRAHKTRRESRRYKREEGFAHSSKENHTRKDPHAENRRVGHPAIA